MNRAEELAKLLPKGTALLALADFDGTLAPIAPTPDLAAISARAKKALIKLAGSKNIFTGVLSGRALHDIKKAVGVKGLIYGGNHGLEIEGRGLKRTAPLSDAVLKALAKVRKDLKGSLSRYKGAIVEDKMFSVSVHYRLVGKKDLPYVMKEIKRSAEPFLKRGLIRLAKGKKIVEIRPRLKWDKGSALKWIQKELSAKSGRSLYTVYMGDDATDEDAFKSLGKKGLSIKVGAEGKTAALKRLDNTEQAGRFLELILESR